MRNPAGADGLGFSGGFFGMVNSEWWAGKDGQLDAYNKFYTYLGVRDV